MPDSSVLPDAFRHVFQANADADCTMRFDHFMSLALYHRVVGYYAAPRPRIGFEKGTDFYTSATSNPVFGELVAAACISLLGTRPVSEYTFWEIGAESSGGVLEHVAHPFKAVRTCRLGEPMDFRGKCVVFSNELFDAQPFRRFVARHKQWREHGVQQRAGRLFPVEIAVSELPCDFPVDLAEGYVIDAPLAAADLASNMATQPWTGLFVACDYGKSWREIIEVCPAGTARAYFRHTQSNDLFAHPGQQDITCHVCWDWLASTIEHLGFVKPTLESQESFFVRHAGEYIASVTAADALQFTRRKASLLQLLHPAHLGQKFQVLHALRD